MSKTKDLLWDADRLARFLNVRGLQEAKSFRAANADFFPPDFWKKSVPALPYDPLPEEPGGPELYGADLSGFFVAIGLKNRPKSLPYWWSLQQRFCEAWRRGFPLETCINLIASASPILGVIKAWPYQRAVMFLSNESWRARFCGQCGMRFVADKPARRFCSGKCSAKGRRTTRAVSWKKHGEEWRARYEKKRASRKPKAKQAA